MIFLRYKKILSITIIVLLMSVIIILFLKIDIKSNPSIHKPVNGVLDLENWDYLNDGVLDLSGEWNFYWKKLISSSELKTLKPDLLVSVPSIWNGYKLDNKNLSSFGYGTYVLKVKNYNIDAPISLKFENASSAYKLFIDNKLIISNGDVGIDKQSFKPEYKPKKIQFQPKSKDFDIIIQISNFVYFKGGMWYPLYMGTPNAVQNFNDMNISKDVFLIGAFFVMALYYLCIFLLRKEYKANLYFVISCLIAILKTLTMGEYLVYNIFPFIGFESVNFLYFMIFYWYPVIFILLIQSLFPNRVSKVVVNMLIVFGCAMTIISLIMPLYIYAEIAYFEIAIVDYLSIIYSVICTIKAMEDNLVDASIMFVGAFAMIFGGVHDYMVTRNILVSYFGEITHFCFFIMVTLSAIVLAKRFSNSFEHNEILKKELKKINKTLEDRVIERTEQLNISNEKLVSNNVKLEKNIFELDETMKALKVTQNQLIQSEKMAVLGQLSAGVAHEINNPLGAINASNSNIINSMNEIVKGINDFVRVINSKQQVLFFDLLEKSVKVDLSVSTKDKRKYRKAVIQQLEEKNIEDVYNVADRLVDMGIYSDLEEYIPILKSSNSSFILNLVYSFSSVFSNSSNIEIAVQRASKTVYALKSYTYKDNSGVPVEHDVRDSINNTLTIYNSKLKYDIELIKNYESIPKIMCFPDELNQVWTNIIYNALQAMNYKGILQIDILKEDKNVLVKITDNGKGISPDIKDKIFLPLFTTKPNGEGTGLGLDIVKNIVLKHNGDIDVESNPERTTFIVRLPFA